MGKFVPHGSVPIRLYVINLFNVMTVKVAATSLILTDLDVF